MFKNIEQHLGMPLHNYMTLFFTRLLQEAQIKQTLDVVEGFRPAKNFYLYHFTCVRVQRLLREYRDYMRKYIASLFEIEYDSPSSSTSM
jgi:hypothetical protein